MTTNRLIPGVSDLVSGICVDLRAHALPISSRFLSKCFSIRTTGLLSATPTTTCWTSRRNRRRTSCPHPSWWTSTGILTLLIISAWCRAGRTARRISSYLSWDTWLTVRSVFSPLIWQSLNLGVTQLNSFNSVAQAMGSWLSRYLASRRQRTEKACWTTSSDSCRTSKMSGRTFSSSPKKPKVHSKFIILNCYVASEVCGGEH